MSKTEINTEVTETFTINDMEAAFNMSRDKMYNSNGTFREYRFVNFVQFMKWREFSLGMHRKPSQPNNNQ